MNFTLVKQYLSDRTYLVSLIALILLAFVIIVISLINIQPGELRIPVRYSLFDQRNYALDQWYYLLSFPAFAALVATLHTLLSAKLYQAKGRIFALGTVYLGLIILVMALVVFMSIFRVVSLS